MIINTENKAMGNHFKTKPILLILFLIWGSILAI